MVTSYVCFLDTIVQLTRFGDPLPIFFLLCLSFFLSADVPFLSKSSLVNGVTQMYILKLKHIVMVVMFILIPIIEWNLLSVALAGIGFFHKFILWDLQCYILTISEGILF